MRIFVDCSFIDFSRQPTGIPRVVLKYVETGYLWGTQRGIDVVPVVTTKDGLYPVRPLPGDAPPESVVRYVNPDVAGVTASKESLEQLKLAEEAMLGAVMAAGFASATKSVSSGVASLFSQLTSGVDDPLQILVRADDLVFFPAYWHDIPPLHIKNLQEKGAKVFILVHDILPITFAKFYREPWRYEFADNLLEACRYADGLFAVSSFTAQGVEDFARDNGVAIDKVRVLHNGYDPLVEDPAVLAQIDSGNFVPSFAKRTTYDFLAREHPYLMVGSIEPKKGHVPAIRAFEHLWSKGLRRKLVLIGRRGWLEDEVVAAIKRSPYFGERLFWFDNLDDTDLLWAYRHSRGLIFASYAEGFGIPLIEAAQARLPSICYDTDVAREVGGRSALFYSNLEQFTGHVALLEDDAHWQQERAKLASFSWPSWRETGHKLYEQLSSLAAVPPTATLPA